MPYVGQSLTTLADEKVQQITRDACRGMSFAAGRRIHEVVKMNTPVKTGRLRESWVVGAPNKSARAGYSAYGTSVSTDVEYAPYVEYGTGLWGPKHAKYVILPKIPGGTLHWVDADGDHFAKKVMHPGSPPNHMMAIALAVVDGEANATLFDRVLHQWVRDVEASIH